MRKTTRLSCACDEMHIEVEGAPIVSSECHCNSCRAAGARLLSLPGAPRFMERNGGTRFVLYRKDRIRFIEGADRLREFRLTPVSKTRRVVAGCCNTPIFLEFQNGHWLSLYGCLWREGTLPPLDLRTMMGDLPDRSGLADDIPNGRWQSAAFFARLFGAWVAMGFKSPKITLVDGEIDA
jgi:hypothetical protein